MFSTLADDSDMVSYNAGYQDRMNNVPFNHEACKEWKAGWLDADRGLKTNPIIGELE